MPNAWQYFEEQLSLIVQVESIMLENAPVSHSAPSLPQSLL